jgi:lysophosphatidylcholine acyltransferase / lyso-PAF acetyltransferase
MHWFYWVLAAYIVLVQAFLVKQVNKCFNIYLQAYKNLSPEVKKKYFVYIRVESAKLQKWKFILAALTTGPIKLHIVILVTLFSCLLTKIFCIGANPAKPYSRFRVALLHQVKSLIANNFAFCTGFGFNSLSFKKARIQDYDPDYPEQSQEELTQKPVLIVCNHSCSEMFFVMPRFKSSDISKWEYQFTPFLGASLARLQWFFVRRGQSEEFKRQQMQLLTDRLDLIQNNETMPPLLIAPEGTTNNNQGIMTFKKGAFKDFKPVKIVCVKYSTQHFMPFNDLIPQLIMFVMLFCNWSNHAEITEFEGVYDPKNIKGIDFNDENAWKVYAERVRDVMAKCLNLPKVDFGYRHWKEFQAIYEKEVRRLQGKPPKNAR